MTSNKSPFQKRNIWRDSLLLQLQQALLREEGNAQGIEAILVDNGTDLNLIAEAKLRGTITHDEADPFVIKQIQLAADICSDPNCTKPHNKKRKHIELGKRNIKQ